MQQCSRIIIFLISIEQLSAAVQQNNYILTFHNIMHTFDHTLSSSLPSKSGFQYEKETVHILVSYNISINVILYTHVRFITATEQDHSPL